MVARRALTVNQRATTLVEIMAVMAITAIVALMAYGLIRGVSRYFWETRTALTLQREAQTCLAVLTRSLKEAKASTIVFFPRSPFNNGLGFTEFNTLATPFRFEHENMKFFMDDLNDPSPKTLLTNNMLSFFVYWPEGNDPTRVSFVMVLGIQRPDKSWKTHRIESLDFRLQNP
jgi:type II secretory pathway pseudopilin PulG